MPALMPESELQHLANDIVCGMVGASSGGYYCRLLLKYTTGEYILNPLFYAENKGEIEDTPPFLLYVGHLARHIYGIFYLMPFVFCFTFSTAAYAASCHL